MRESPVNRGVVVVGVRNSVLKWHIQLDELGLIFSRIG